MHTKIYGLDSASSTAPMNLTLRRSLGSFSGFGKLWLSVSFSNLLLLIGRICGSLCTGWRDFGYKHVPNSILRESTSKVKARCVFNYNLSSLCTDLFYWIDWVTCYARLTSSWRLQPCPDLHLLTRRMQYHKSACKRRNGLRSHGPPVECSSPPPWSLLIPTAIARSYYLSHVTRRYYVNAAILTDLPYLLSCFSFEALAILLVILKKCMVDPLIILWSKMAA